MTTFQYEYKYLSAGLLELETYLLSNELYWPVPVSAAIGDAGYPMMTLGNLLLSLIKASVLHRDTQEKEAYKDVETKLNSVQQKWQTAWERKASVEFSARLRLWQLFLDEFQKTPLSNFDRYSYEVGRRVIIELVKPFSIDISDGERESLLEFDRYLDVIFLRGDFIWDENLQPAFSPDTFWFLYGTLKY